MKPSCLWQRLSLIVMLVVLALQAAPVGAQGPELHETFDDAALPGWEVGPGATSATAAGGVLSVASGGFAFHGGRWRWGDFTLTLRVRRTGEGPLIVQYCASDQGGYSLTFDEEEVALDRMEAGNAVALGRGPAALPTGQWAQLEIAAAGSAHVVAVDGKTILSAADQGDPLAGGVILSAAGAPREFDDITLTIAAETPGAPPTAPGATPPPTGAPAYQAGAWARLGGPIGGLGYDIRYNFRPQPLVRD